MTEEIIAYLGPLAPLAGTWESDQGIDTSRIHGEETITKFREKIVFEPLGPAKNGPQELYGLRYSTVCWRLNEEEPFHEELGYWLWDKDQEQVLRCFLVPRGMAVNAGGFVKTDNKHFHLEAELGSETYGIVMNRYLHNSYKTKRYSLDVDVHPDGTFSYMEDTQLWIPVKQEIFHHTDQNTLVKI